MDAMILAAGRGSRLGELGARTPKALLRVGGTTLLERTLARLASAGADRIIVNVHHHADRIEAVLVELAPRFERTDILVSSEPDQPLETGGGLVHAAPLFRRDAPFFLHNVDVVSDCDLQSLYEAHGRQDCLATLAVHERRATRELLFDAVGLLGRWDLRTGRKQVGRPPAGPVLHRAFTGIHVISPRIFEHLEPAGAFSIIDAYLRLVERGHVVRPHDISGSMWLEVGTPERLEAARRALER